MECSVGKCGIALHGFLQEQNCVLYVASTSPELHTLGGFYKCGIVGFVLAPQAQNCNVISGRRAMYTVQI